MMNWYFACNEQSFELFPLIEAAVYSAIKNTSLKPYFIFDGAECEFTQKLREKGVEIIFHRSSFYNSLKKHYNEAGLKIASGAFLRCDIPLIEQEDEFVLYTDCDVLFLKDFNIFANNGLQPIVLDLKPKFFACSSQSDKNNFSHFNTGVMLMNVKKLKESHSKFCKFITDNLGIMIALDQSAYQIFYSGKNTKLPTKFNHKPYWGIAKNAAILHFHGVKPTDFTSDETLKGLNYSAYKLFKQNISAYDFYLNLFKEYYPEIQYNQDAIEKLKNGTYPTSKKMKNKLKHKFKSRINKIKVTIVNKFINRAIFK